MFHRALSTTVSAALSTTWTVTRNAVSGLRWAVPVGLLIWLILVMLLVVLL